MEGSVSDYGISFNGAIAVIHTDFESSRFSIGRMGRDLTLLHTSHRHMFLYRCHQYRLLARVSACVARGIPSIRSDLMTVLLSFLKFVSDFLDDRRLVEGIWISIRYRFSLKPIRYRIIWREAYTK